MKRQGKQKTPEPAESPSRGMSIDTILEQLAKAKDQTVWQSVADACEAATDILTALQDEGIEDPEQVRDLIHDYNALAIQYQKMHQKHEEPKTILRIGGVGARAACLCPDCRSQSRPGNAYCWNCGQRLGWGR